MAEPYTIGIMLAFSAALFNAAYSLIARVAMKDVEDTKAWAITYQMAAGMLYLIPAMFFLEFPKVITPYYYLIGASLLWAVYIILAWASYKSTQVSVRQTLNSTKNIFIIILAYLILGESITVNKIGGALIIIVGISVLSYKNWIWNEKGTFLTLGSAGSQATARTFDKFAIPFFSTWVYAAIQFFLPAFWVSLTQKSLAKRIKKILKYKNVWLLITIFIGGAAAFFQFESYRLLDVSSAVLIMESSTVFATLGGILFLKEKKKVVQKLLGSLIVTLGVIFLILF